MNNDINKEKMVELLMKLEKKQITKEEYNEELKSLVTSEEYINNMNNAKKLDLSLLKKPWIIALIIISILTIIISLISPNIGKQYEYIDDYYKIKEPIQKEYNESKTIKVSSNNVKIDLNYSYDISGYVLASFNYFPLSLSNKLSPVDVGLAWSDLVKPENLNHLKWMESGHRYIYWKTKDSAWYESYGDFTNKYSNNHLVGSTPKITSLIKKIRKGDFIHLKGYLINAYWTSNNKNYYWTSSTTRDDKGMGACEVLYVTDIKWLKEK